MRPEAGCSEVRIPAAPLERAVLRACRRKYSAEAEALSRVDYWWIDDRVRMILPEVTAAQLEDLAHLTAAQHSDPAHHTAPARLSVSIHWKDGSRSTLKEAL